MSELAAYTVGTPMLYESGSETIAGYGPLLRLSAEELFNPDSPPVAYCTQPGSGKTSAAVAAVYANARRATGLFYVTDGYSTERARYLQKMIPSIHVRKFDLQTLCELWGMIQQKAVEAVKALDDRKLREFIERHCANHPGYRYEIDRINQVRMANVRDFPDNPDVTAAIEALKVEVSRTFIRNTFRRDDTRLLKPEQELVGWCQSSTPLPVVIFDDVTASLQSAPSGKFQIPTLGDDDTVKYAPYSGAKALERLLMLMMTTTRQAVSMTFFIHEIGVFSPSVRQNIGAIVLDGPGVTEVCRQAVVSAEGKSLIEAAWAKISDTDRYKYHRVVYYADPGTTSHGQRVAIFKAPYYTEPRPVGVPTYRLVIDSINREAEKHNAMRAMAQTTRAEEEASKKRVEQLATAAPPAPSAPMSGVRPLPAVIAARPIGRDPLS